MIICVIGQGYVGLTISAFAGQAHDVIGFDTNSEIVNRLNQGISHIEGVESSVILELISIVPSKNDIRLSIFFIPNPL